MESSGYVGSPSPVAEKTYRLNFGEIEEKALRFLDAELSTLKRSDPIGPRVIWKNMECIFLVGSAKDIMQELTEAKDFWRECCNARLQAIENDYTIQKAQPGADVTGTTQEKHQKTQQAEEHFENLEQFFFNLCSEYNEYGDLGNDVPEASAEEALMLNRNFSSEEACSSVKHVSFQGGLAENSALLAPVKEEEAATVPLSGSLRRNSLKLQKAQTQALQRDNPPLELGRAKSAPASSTWTNTYSSYREELSFVGHKAPDLRSMLLRRSGSGIGDTSFASLASLAMDEDEGGRELEMKVVSALDNHEYVHRVEKRIGSESNFGEVYLLKFQEITEFRAVLKVMPVMKTGGDLKENGKMYSKEFVYKQGEALSEPQKTWIQKLVANNEKEIQIAKQASDLAETKQGNFPFVYGSARCQPPSDDAEPDWIKLPPASKWQDKRMRAALAEVHLLVSEVATHSDFDQYMSDNDPKEEGDLCGALEHRFILQVLEAIKALQQKKIVHDDLHTRNVLVTEDQDLQRSRGMPLPTSKENSRSIAERRRSLIPSLTREADLSKLYNIEDTREHLPDLKAMVHDFGTSYYVDGEMSDGQRVVDMIRFFEELAVRGGFSDHVLENCLVGKKVKTALRILERLRGANTSNTPSIVDKIIRHFLEPISDLEKSLGKC